jgi:prepilin-type N-terminal cleavage/methylation domain-containing protein
VRRARGFTIIEMMVSLALGGILLAGAFELHAAFTRQSTRSQEVADMQQSLRVSRQIMERSIRGAGSGLREGAIYLNTCGGPVTYYSVLFSNSNIFPQAVVDNTPGDADTDPDWIQIVALNPSTGTEASSDGGTNAVVTNIGAFSVGQQFVLVDTGPTVANRRSCAYEVTSLTPNVAVCPTCGTVDHAPGGTNCINPGADPCIGGITYPAPVRSLTGGSTVFRVDQSDVKTPRLMVSFAPLGQPAVWQPIAENIEDLQIALVMADGSVCGRSGNSVDDPALCNPRSARAVRFTLTARSSNLVSAFAQGQSGGTEDMPINGSFDQYLRRSVTTEVQLRNSP